LLIREEGDEQEGDAAARHCACDSLDGRICPSGAARRFDDEDRVEEHKRPEDGEKRNGRAQRIPPNAVRDSMMRRYGSPSDLDVEELLESILECLDEAMAKISGRDQEAVEAKQRERRHGEEDIDPTGPRLISE
jgi:hypothetical protein